MGSSSRSSVNVAAMTDILAVPPARIHCRQCARRARPRRRPLAAAQPGGATRCPTGSRPRWRSWRSPCASTACSPRRPRASPRRASWRKLAWMDKTTLVVTLDEMERRGLAERRVSPADRRVRVIALTDAGPGALRRADRWSGRLRRGAGRRGPGGAGDVPRRCSAQLGGRTAGRALPHGEAAAATTAARRPSGHPVETRSSSRKSICYGTAMPYRAAPIARRVAADRALHRRR